MERKLLKKIMAERGFAPKMLAKKTGILSVILRFKLWGIGEFTLGQIGKIVRVLNLSAAEINRIFFGEKVS